MTVKILDKIIIYEILNYKVIIDLVSFDGYLRKHYYPQQFENKYKKSYDFRFYVQCFYYYEKFCFCFHRFFENLEDEPHIDVLRNYVRDNFDFEYEIIDNRMSVPCDLKLIRHDEIVDIMSKNLDATFESSRSTIEIEKLNKNIDRLTILLTEFIEKRKLSEEEIFEIKNGINK